MVVLCKKQKFFPARPGNQLISIEIIMKKTLTFLIGMTLASAAYAAGAASATGPSVGPASVGSVKG